jgi:hypothetical protein
MKFKEFDEYIDYLVTNEIPPTLLKSLNGGIRLSKALQQDDDEKDYYILGEYIEDELGFYINIYYGSFMHFYGDKSNKIIKKEILSTIKHELTHHIESLAGNETLAYEEDIEVAKRKKE